MVPGPTTTGVPAGTALTVMTGDQHLTTAGAVLDAVDLKGCTVIDADNVTVRQKPDHLQ